MKKRTSFLKLFVQILPLVIFGACHSPNVLKYKLQKYYYEDNILSTKQENTLHQRVCFNKPNVIDEEHCYEISFSFLDKQQAISKGVIHLESDTAVVRCEYGVFSIWNWSKEQSKIKGTIEILCWEEGEVELKEKVYVEDIRRKKNLKFIGVRKFKNYKNW